MSSQSITPLRGLGVYTKYFTPSSESCGVQGTIIELTKHLLKTKDLALALRFLRKVYRIEFSQSEWLLHQRQSYKSNVELLNSEQFQTGYLVVYQRVKHYMPFIEIMNQLALEHATTENFTDSSGRAVFFASIGHIASLLGKGTQYHKQVSKVIAFLTYIGLVNKLAESDIPEHMLRTAKHHAALKKQAKIVSFYSIPSYDLKILDFAVRKATEFIDCGFTMKGWGRELLLRTLGEDEANRVYPQERGKELPQINVEVAQKIEMLALELIGVKGWATDLEILSLLELRFKGQQRFKEIHVKRVLPDMLNKYCLVRQRLNKELKQALNINVKGYPFVILKENEHEQVIRTRTETSTTTFSKESNKTVG